MDWVWENKEWLFSGVAVVLATGVVTWLFRRRDDAKVRYKQKQSGGARSTNIQIGSIGRDEPEK